MQSRVAEHVTRSVRRLGMLTREAGKVKLAFVAGCF
jgi:hypothetical protein